MDNETLLDDTSLTRRDMIAVSALAAGAALTGCDKAPKRVQMPRRKLGRTGFEVGVVGFGTEWMERHTQGECDAVTRRCEEYGMNLLDCWSADPAVRDRVGRSLKGHRDRWIIQGHIGTTWQDGKYVRTREVGPCRIAFDDLLKRFETDHVEIGMVHCIDRPNEYADFVSQPFQDFLKELKSAGKIRCVGISTHNPETAIKAVKGGLVDMIMFSVNPAYDLLPPVENVGNYYRDDAFDSALGGIAKERAELYRLCEEKGVGITVMKAYAGGRLFDKARSPFQVALTPVQCIHYALTRPGVVSVLSGYDTVEHVDAAAAYAAAPRYARNYARVLANAPRHAYDGQCTYCGHCHPCKNGIDIAMVSKLYDLAAMQPTVPDTVRAHYMALPHHASECKACHTCEKRCPFHVKVSERMKLVAKLFGV